MLNLSERVFVFTDLHFGIHSNNQSYIDICSNTLDWISKYCSKESIKDIIFMGDFFDSRASIDVKTLNAATQSLYSLVDSGVNITMILGNHDIYLRDSTAIHSLLAFGGRNGIRIVDTPETATTCCTLHGHDKILLLPWMYGTLSKHVDVSDDVKYVFSHHDFPANYFMGGAGRRKTNCSDTYTSTNPYEEEYGIQQQILERVVANEGFFFSGHIHQRKEIPVGNCSKIVIEGSPYETSWGFGNVQCGAYVVDFSNNCYNFVPNPHNKAHVEIHTSNPDKDMEGVDFHNSIVRLNVDTRESFDTISKLQAKINSLKPFSVENTKYEFAVAEFVGNRDEFDNPVDAVGDRVSSKIDYINGAIEKGDFSAFSYIDNNDNIREVDKNKLKEIANEIFEASSKHIH